MKRWSSLFLSIHWRTLFSLSVFFFTTTLYFNHMNLHALCLLLLVLRGMPATPPIFSSEILWIPFNLALACNPGEVELVITRHYSEYPEEELFSLYRGPKDTGTLLLQVQGIYTAPRKASIPSSWRTRGRTDGGPTTAITSSTSQRTVSYSSISSTTVRPPIESPRSQKHSTLPWTFPSIFIGISPMSLKVTPLGDFPAICVRTLRPVAPFQTTQRWSGTIAMWSTP